MASSDAIPSHDAPIPMSFPAVLGMPAASDRYAHLRTSITTPAVTTIRRPRNGGDKDGKRWVRRSENARFVGNPHIVPASKKDYALALPNLRSTFPKPLPPYLPRSSDVPGRALPIREPISANAGRFSLSLRGMRKTLRRSGGPRTRQLVQAVEGEINEWLRRGGVILAPDSNEVDAEPAARLLFDPVYEVSRTVHQLVWSVDDAWCRYVVHACARYHSIVSFSKDVNGQRLTYLLRPNVFTQDFRATAYLDTPPITDLSAHEFDSESDAMSVVDSDAPHEGVLESIEEGSDASRPPSSLAGAPPRLADLDEEWSVIGDSDADADAESLPDAGLADSIESLTLQDDADATPRRPARRQLPLREQMLHRRQDRSNSSPSPARRPHRRGHRQIRNDPPRVNEPQSFYDYLFA